MLGFLLIIISLLQAFSGLVPYYWLFVIGWWLLFDSIHYRTTKNSLLSGAAKNPGFFVLLYFVFFIVGLITDLFYGQIIAGLWLYPHYTLFVHWALLYLIVYPVGGFALVETYKVFESKFAAKKQIRHRTVKANTYIVTGFLLLIIPVVNFLFLGNIFQNYIFSLWLFGGIIFAYGLTILFKGNSILNDIKGKIYSLLVASLLAAVWHEYPNTFVYEWVYKNMPLTDATLLNIPVIIFLGWIFLALISIETYNWVEALYKHYSKTL